MGKEWRGRYLGRWKLAWPLRNPLSPRSIGYPTVGLPTYCERNPVAAREAREAFKDETVCAHVCTLCVVREMLTARELGPGRSCLPCLPSETSAIAAHRLL